MTSDYRDLAQRVLQLTLGVGNGQVGVQDAMDELRVAIARTFDLSGIAEIWQVRNKSNDILRVLYPEHGILWESDDNRVPGQGAIPLDESVGILICDILCGVDCLDRNRKRSQGASELLDACSSPLPEPETPFAGGMTLAEMIDFKLRRRTPRPPGEAGDTP